MEGTEGPIVLSLEARDYTRQVENWRCDVLFSTVPTVDGLAEFWVFGQSLLRKYATIYDLAKGRVGFALPTGVQATPGSGFSVAAERRMRLRRPAPRAGSSLLQPDS